MARPKATQINEEINQEVEAPKKEPKKIKKSKIGNFYRKWKLLDRHTDSDKITHFDINGDKKDMGVISLPENTARILNNSTKFSGIYYELEK